MQFSETALLIIASVVMLGGLHINSHATELNSNSWAMRGTYNTVRSSQPAPVDERLTAFLTFKSSPSLAMVENRTLKAPITKATPETLQSNDVKENQINDLPEKMVLHPLTPRQRSQPKNSLTLSSAINRAVARHPDIVTANSIENREQANVKIAQSVQYPQVSFGGGTGSSFGTNRTSSNSIGINAEQLVYDFNRSNSLIKSAKSSVTRARADIDATTERISAEAAMAYIAALRAKALYYSAEDSLVSLQRIRDIIRLRADSGVSDQADLVLANVRVDGAESELVGAETAELAARSSLISLTGSGYSGLLPIDKLLANMDKSLNRNLLDNHPSILAAQQEVQATKYLVNAERASIYPSLGVSGSYQYDPIKGNTNSNIMLSIKGNLYQGGATRARIAAANDNEKAAKYRVDSIRLTNGTQFDVASEDAIGSAAQKRIVGQQINRAIASRDLFFEQYQLGKRSLTDLLNADAAIYSAINTKIEIEYRYRSAVIKKAQAVGVLRQKLEI